MGSSVISLQTYVLYNLQASKRLLHQSSISTNLIERINMASKPVLLALVLFLSINLVFCDQKIDPQVAGPVDCGGLCQQRCSLHSRPNLCHRACGTCCVRCKCVPPGTYGNREVCGSCYTDMKTHGNRPKCP